MSEYQYYEFLAVDRPLDKAAQKALRAISSRAKITATSFVNEYEWGDFKGDPNAFMEQWFDLHVYLANWGTRRFMMRVPERLVQPEDIAPFVREIEWVTTWTSGDDLIVDCLLDDDSQQDWVEGPGQLTALAPLRAAVLSGDLRFFYLLWLVAIQYEGVDGAAIEPLPGIAPLTEPLEAVAEFFNLDRDLLAGAAETGAAEAPTPKESLREALAAIGENEKTELLSRLVEGDAHVAADLARRLRRGRRPVSSAPRRTADALRARAQEIAAERENAKAKAASKARRARADALRKRGESAWDEVEQEIERREAQAYVRALGLLADLRALAEEDGAISEFDRRLASIRMRHKGKRTFIERLAKL